MKKAHSLVLMMIISFPSMAQLGKGNIQLGGSTEIGTQSSENTSLSDDYNSEYRFFNFSPKVGYFITKNSALGLSFGYNTSKSTFTQEPNYSQDTHNKSFSVGPYLKRYIMLGDRAAILLNANALVGFGKSTIINNLISGSGSEYNTTFFNTSVSAGFSYFISEKWGLEATFGRLQYSSNIQKTDEPDSGQIATNNIGFDFDFVIPSFSVQYFICR